MLDFENLKASDVLQAMVTGLQKSKNDPDFVVKMETFGKVKNNLCYGCCATLTLAEMFGKGQSASELMLGFIKTSVDDSGFAYAFLSDVIPLEPLIAQDSLPITLENLEEAVDKARMGSVSWLIRLLTGKKNASFDRRWYLRSDNWEEKLPDVEVTIAEMIAAGY